MKRCGCLLLSLLAGYALQAAPTRSELLAKLPLRFEESSRQTAHPSAQYTARGQHFLLSLARTENWMEWSGPEGRRATVNTRLRNSNPNARIDPEGLSSAAVNYFVGVSKNWRTGVRGFERVRYRDVYPGIDLLFHGEQERLEYDFIIAPGADPKRIELDLSGQREARVSKEGDLIISTDAGEIEWKRPEIFQDVAGTRKQIAGQFVLSGARSVRFEIAAYDRRRPLVIDPVLKYSTYIGHKGNDSARGIAVDRAGNVYVSGATSTSDLDTVSAYQPNFGGMTAGVLTGDGFIAKFSPTGALLYLTYLGGSFDDGITAIAVDASGNAYLTGETNSSDFPLVNPFQSTFAGMGGSVSRTGDAFVAKLNPTGNQLLYSTYLGGSQDDIGLAITIDAAGNAYIAGATASQNFPVTAGVAFQSTFGGAGGEPIRHQTDTVPLWEPGDAFAAKLDPTGSKLLYSTYLGGSADEAALSIALDAANNVVLGGCTISRNFPTKNAMQGAYGGDEVQNFFFTLGDGFIAKLNSTGSDLVYSTYFGGSGDDCITAIALDSSGSVYMTGNTTSRDLTVSQGAYQSVYAGYYTLPVRNRPGFWRRLRRQAQPDRRKPGLSDLFGWRQQRRSNRHRSGQLRKRLRHGIHRLGQFPSYLGRAAKEIRRQWQPRPVSLLWRCISHRCKSHRKRAVVQQLLWRKPRRKNIWTRAGCGRHGIHRRQYGLYRPAHHVQRDCSAARAGSMATYPARCAAMPM